MKEAESIFPPAGPTAGPRLWYRQPATRFEEALPIGSGRLGAMIYGGVGVERISLNEDSLWSGRPQSFDLPSAPGKLQEIRSALFADDFSGAAKSCSGLMGPYSQSFLPAGSLRIYFDHALGFDYYRRVLDIDRALGTVSYRCGAVNYTREAFASYRDQLIVLRLRTSQPGSIIFSTHFDSLLRGCQRRADNGDLVFTGQAPSHLDPAYRTRQRVVYDDPLGSGMLFQMRLRILTPDGKVLGSDAGCAVRGASDVELRLSIATGFDGFDRNPAADESEVAARASAHLDAARELSYEDLLDRHTKSCRPSKPARLSLGPPQPGPELEANWPPNANRPAGAESSPDTAGALRLAGAAAPPDTAALYFSYSSYLLASASRDGSRAANLQGVWNEQLQAPWCSNYTTNINAQMNYWSAEVAAGGGSLEPLFDLIRVQSITGRQAASNYGCRGWCTHHNTDIWGLSCAVGDGGHGSPVFAIWPMGGAWLCRHLWDHYRFTLDREFLEATALPLMKGAALFCLDWLIEHNINGKTWLVTAPSTSPENCAAAPGGILAPVGIASTMDMAIIRELFTYTLEALSTINDPDPIGREIEGALPRLFPYQVGAAGQLQEWYRDWHECEPHHRHVSHLYGMYPSDLIQLERDPDLAAAVRRSLELRGDEATGWSLAWKICLWARLREGDRAWSLVQMALRLVEEGDIQYDGGGGVYPNLLDAHPPFQIDGNSGVAAGMAEMLLQSHRYHEEGDEKVVVLDVLPALPGAWHTGKIAGLRARGGFEVDIEWTEGRLAALKIGSRQGGRCLVRAGDRVQKVELRPGESYIVPPFQ